MSSEPVPQRVRGPIPRKETGARVQWDEDQRKWRDQEMWNMFQTGIRQGVIGEKFGLSQQMVSRTISRMRRELQKAKQYADRKALLDRISETSTGTKTLEAQARIPVITGTIHDFTASLGYTDKPFHHDWYEIAENQSEFLLLAPRRHAKSTCFSINYVLWRIARNPNVRILLVSNTDRQAKRFVYEVKTRIERFFPQLVPADKAKWAETEFIVERDKILKDSTLSAVGVNGPIVSRRIDLIIMDDIVDLENSASDVLREKIFNEWYKGVLKPTLEPNGQILIVGTPFSPDDFYASLIHDGFPSKSYDAIVDEDKKESLWPEVLPYECPQGTPHKANCCLSKIRHDLGTVVFNAQYRCDSSGYSGRKLKIEWLRKSWYRTLPENLEITMGCDPAISKKTQADYFAIAVCGYSQAENKIYVMDFYRGHYDFPEQLAKITDVWQLSRASRIIVESTAYQEALAQSLIGSGLPVIPYKTVKDKTTRIMAVSPYFENGQIRCKDDMDDFIDEFVKWDGEHSAHDDLIDALCLAVQDIIDRHSPQKIDYHPTVEFGQVYKSRIPEMSSSPLFVGQKRVRKGDLGEPGEGKQRILNMGTGQWEWV